MLDKAELIALSESVDALDRDGYKTGAAWNVAHDLAQQHEGKAEFDWLHAMLHRIEGDTGNARYWYRRAGRDAFEGSLREEAKAMLAELKED